MRLYFPIATVVVARMTGTGITTVGSGMPFCIGCELAENGQFPWQASLQTSGHFCGAAIISSTFLNCAAHCKSSVFTANVGDVDNTKGQQIRAKTYISHPNYNGNLIINDFAVIQLASEIVFNDWGYGIISTA